MKVFYLREIGVFILACAVLVTIAGCDKSTAEKATTGRRELEKSAASIESGTTIGQLADVFSPDYIPVQGYAIVGELAGTGSADCPPQIRDYLKKYILRYMPRTDIDKFINSPDTAVVIAEGMMPTDGKNSLFDVRVAVPGAAQTTSLEYGQLYGAELRAAGSFGLTTKVLAKVEGPVYIDKIDPPADPKIGYILGGGRALDNYKMLINLRKPDFFVANVIRNKLIERFGANAAKAVSAQQVEMTPPAQFIGRKQHFIAIIMATYLNLSPADREKRISELVAQLAGSDADNAEIRLEAIGKDAIGPLMEALNSADADVSFSAARTLMNLGSDKGLSVLSNVAYDTSSDRRIEALDAVAANAKHNDAVGLCRRLLRDDDTAVVLAAYEQLRKFDDISINEEYIGRTFFLENITIGNKKLIFVARSGPPRIVLFGGPLHCKANLFIQSADGNITLNAPPGQNYVTIIRKVPARPDIPPISVDCSYELGDIIKTLGAEPARRNPTDPVGLGIAYSDIVAMLNQMVSKGAVDCRFDAGPMPQIGLK